MNRQSPPTSSKVAVLSVIFALSSLVSLGNICGDHPPGSFLPVMNKSDEFIICREDGTDVAMKCKTGFIYNALTTACEKGKDLFVCILSIVVESLD